MAAGVEEHPIGPKGVRTLEKYHYQNCIDLEINDSLYWEDPHTSVQRSAGRFTRPVSLAPKAWDTQASTPMAKAHRGERTSQRVVELRPTAAEAL